MKENLKSSPKPYSAISVLVKLIRFARPYYGAYMILGLFIFIKAVLGVATAEVFRQMVAAATAGNVRLLWMVLAVAIGIAAILFLIGLAETAMSVRVQNRSTLALQTYLLNKLFRIRMNKFTELTTADWINRVQQNAEYAMSAINTRAVLIVGDLLQILFLFVYLATISGKLLFGSLCIAVCIPLLVSPLSGKLRKQYDTQQEMRAKRDSVIQNMLQGGEEVRTYSLASHMEHWFQRQYERLLYVSRNVIRLESGIALGSYMTPFLGLLFILGFGGVLVTRGELVVGDVVAFLIGMERMIGPVSGLAQVWAQTQDAVSHGHRVLQVIEMPEEKREGPFEGIKGDQLLDAGTPRIVFDQVSFHYHENTPALKDVSFIIEHAQMTAIIGASGSGKTTLVNMICRYTEPISGNLMFGSVPYRDIDPRWLRAKIAYVPQQDYLFSLSVLENIRMGDRRYSEQDVVQAARAVRLHDWVMSLEDGYATVLNEGGVDVSGGERQRIALARAVLRNPDFIVLDEPTSHLDVQNELAVLKTLEDLSQNTGIVVVTHRLNRLDRFHKIVSIENGRLTELGAENE